MKKNKFALQIFALSLIILSFIACDKDFANLESDIINEDIATNFDILKDSFPIITYTRALGPVATNNLGLNTLGIYDDAYGRTTSSILTQVTPSDFEPVFGDGVSIDSVVLTLPYFSTATDVEEDGTIIYDLDSVIGNNRMKLRVFESNFFIRDFDPNGEFDDAQSYFSNRSASISEPIDTTSLQNEELIFLTAPETSYESSSEGENIIDISAEGFALETLDDDGNSEITSRIAPGIRVKLDTTFWRNKIIDQEGESVLSNQTLFSDFFRGLYFTVEPVNNTGSFLILDTGVTGSNVTIYYSNLTSSTSDDPDVTEQNTYVLTFAPNIINFMDNDFSPPITSGDATLGDSRIFLKGGEGSVANIKLFNGENIDDDDGTDNAFETFRNEYVDVDEDGNVTPKRLINEANLIFYVDQDAVQTPSITQDNEPNRIYLYDAENNTPLIDYFLDITNETFPSFSIASHLGPLERVNDEPDGNGIKYKLRITEHINNLIFNDSTNVELGLAVSLNVNIESTFFQREVQNSEGLDLTAPVSSILLPRGTILHGNNTDDESKRVFLEVYFTEPN